MSINSYDFQHDYCTFRDRTATIWCHDMVWSGNSRAWLRSVGWLNRCLESLEKKDDLQGLVFYIGSPLDVSGPAASELQQATANQQIERESAVSGNRDSVRQIPAFLRRLVHFPCPTVAAIDGDCSGFMADLAAWCDYRVATNRLGTTIEYSYTRLGELSPLGSESRLARLLGPATAAYLVASGRTIDIRTAFRIGLIDRLVEDTERLAAEARLVAFADALRTDLFARRAELARPRTDIDDIWSAIRNHLLPLLTVNDHPSPETAHRALAQIERTLAADADTFIATLGNQTDDVVPAANASLQHVHQLLRRTRAAFGQHEGVQSRVPLGSIGICGAGIMGSGIAADALAHEIPVVLYDAAAEALDAARARIRAEFEADRALPWGTILSPADAEQHLDVACDESELQQCGLIIESVVENRELKQQILKRLEAASRSDTILASNTSTIPITELANELHYPERFCGFHFCNPVRQRQLVEIVRGAETSARTLAVAIHHARAMGKLPIVTQDRPGFLINRLLVVYLNEAIVMLCEGIPLTTIDRAARWFGMPLGPFELLDLIGTDTAMMAGRSLWDAFPERVCVTPVLPALVKRDRLGWKTRVGFYRYQQIPGPAREDEQLATILEPYIRPRSNAGNMPDAEEIITRLLLPMVLEATRVLDDGVVQTAREIDVGVIFGLAFPASRGGLCYWADQRGARRLVEELRQHEQRGTRMIPTDRLLQMAADRAGFYDLFES